MSQAYAAEQRLSGILRPAAGHLISRTRMGHEASSLAEILRFCPPRLTLRQEDSCFQDTLLCGPE
jgi:hypothetical protein